MKANKLTLAIRAAMSPQALTGAALVLAASQSDAAVINVGGACRLVRAIVAANNDTKAKYLAKPIDHFDTFNAKIDDKIDDYYMPMLNYRL